MRHPRSRAWARCAISAAALVAAVAGLVQGAAAQQKYDRLFVFGDSYADVDLAKFPLPAPLPPGLWTVYPIPLAANLQGLQLLDFAVGGAQTTNLPSQLSNFQGSPTNTIGPRDLVTINIGGNDGIGPVIAGAITTANAEAAAKISADNASAFIGELVKAGAKTFALGEFSGLSGLPIIVGDDKKAAGDLFGQTYFKAMQQNLLPLAQTGTRFFMLDLDALGKQVSADPSKYGLLATTDVNGVKGSQCPVQAGLGSLICGGRIDSPDQKKYFLGPDGLHLTEAGFKLVADYLANNVMAPDTIAVQPGIVMTTTGGFVSTLFGRLDATREARTIAGLGGGGAADGPMGLGAKERSAPPPSTQSGGFTGYAMGTFLGGSRSDAPDQVGFDYDARSGTAGIEYGVNRNLIFGLAANATNTSAGLNNDANIDVDAIQGAAYLSYATRQMFGEVLAAYGSHDVTLFRPGAVDFKPIRSSTDANTVAVAARGGYLFDFGSLRAGPIAGLTYIHTRVAGYTETGDDLATFNVSAQTLDSLTGNLGLRFLAPYRAADGRVIIPYLNVMLEHQFGDGSRTLTVDQVQTGSFLPIMTSFPNFDTRTYGRVETGITLQLTQDLSATITGASTFARDDGQDFRVGAGLNYRF